MMSLHDEKEKRQLYVAVKEKNLITVSSLLEKGADPNIKDKEDCTALHYACLSKEPDLNLISLLIENGADPNIKNKNNCTALHSAAYAGCLESVKLLINLRKRQRAKCNVKNEHGDTPLHYAVRKNRLEVVKYLVEHGSNINIANAEGRTPLQVAIKYNRDNDIVEYLTLKTKSIQRQTATLYVISTLAVSLIAFYCLPKNCVALVAITTAVMVASIFKKVYRRTVEDKMPYLDIGASTELTNLNCLIPEQNIKKL